jgi:hypothetical protein
MYQTNRRVPVCILGVAMSVLLLMSPRAFAQAPDSGPLILETKIPLGRVEGRIDHLAIDLEHHRLFVAELGPHRRS